MNTWEIIFLFFGFQSFLLFIVFLLRNKGDKLANKLLAFYAFLFGYNIIYNVLHWSDYLNLRDYVHLNLTDIICYSLYGPLFFFYTRRVIKKTNFKPIDVIHLAPLFICSISYLPFYFLPTIEKHKSILNNTWTEYILFHNPYTVKTIILIGFFYVAYILVSLRNDIISYHQKIWVTCLTISYMGYLISFIAYYVFIHFDILTVEYDYIISFVMILFIGLLFYFAINQSHVFDGTTLKRIIPIVKYRTSSLSSSFSSDLKQSLINLMTTEKPYLNSEIRLIDIAEKLNSNRHHISQVINEHFDLKFFDFINKYRIEEAKKLLVNKPGMNITEVLYASGFNNRVSFYNAFKKYVGKTPSEFKNSSTQICKSL